MTVKARFDALDAALDAASWEWLEQTHPGVAQALIQEMQRGADPEGVKLHVLRRTSRPELALRLQQAARFLAAQEM